MCHRHAVSVVLKQQRLREIAKVHLRTQPSKCHATQVQRGRARITRGWTSRQPKRKKRRDKHADTESTYKDSIRMERTVSKRQLPAQTHFSPNRTIYNIINVMFKTSS
ncbi:hypothetical protein L596_005548 [Steinernema carpocapsae]|uniref:Uncharacterized protein n=1 Tax=Steinernema carpocapsae TaxID=34508 RepID=A0A4U8UZC9_STECR|nr:hypothetical protein L596_005548 [Steinernema carpocapsae]